MKNILILGDSKKPHMRDTMDNMASAFETFAGYIGNPNHPYRITCKTPLSNTDLFNITKLRIDNANAVCVVIDSDIELVRDLEYSLRGAIEYCIYTHKPLYFDFVFPELVYELQKCSNVLGISAECIGKKDEDSIVLFSVLYDARKED